MGNPGEKWFAYSTLKSTEIGKLIEGVFSDGNLNKHGSEGSNEKSFS